MVLEVGLSGLEVSTGIACVSLASLGDQKVALVD